jgi:hypothetical protein
MVNTGAAGHFLVTVFFFIVVKAGFRRLLIEHLQEIVQSQPVVNGNSLKDARKCAGLYWTVKGNDFVVLAVPKGGHADLGTFFAGLLHNPGRLAP